MIGMYLLVSLICQLQPLAAVLPVAATSSSSAITTTEPAVIQSAPTTVVAGFDDLNGIHVGSPVVAQGQVIGTVAKIVSADSESEAMKSQLQNAQKNTAKETAEFGVELTIKPEHTHVLQDGIVALVSSPLHKGKKTGLSAVIELLNPISRAGAALLPKGSFIRGFSSFERFWASPVA